MVRTLFCCAAWVLPALATAAEQPKGGLALSIGTGPMPLDTLTLGLGGLGARVMFPGAGRAYPYANLAHTSVSTVVGDEDEDKGDLQRVSLSVSSIGGGLRVDLRDRGVDLLPYVAGGGVFSTYGVKSGTKSGDFDVTRALGGQFTGGVGLDAFLIPVLSIGAEVGGIGMIYNGKSSYQEDVYGTHKVSGFGTYAAVSATVWR
jgi:hypothetical protein